VTSDMKKKGEPSKKFRRKTKMLAAGAVALISVASMSITPITASAQTLLTPPSSIGKSIPIIQTLPILPGGSSGSSGRKSGLPDPAGTVTGVINGVTGTVSGVVNGVVGGVTGAVGSAIGQQRGGSLPTPDPSTVTNILKDPVSAIQNGASSLPQLPTGTTPSQDPTKVIGQVTDGLKDPSTGLQQVTDALKDPAKGLQQVTDALKDPAKGLQQVTDTLKNGASSLPVVGSGGNLPLPGTSGQSGDLYGGANVDIMKNESLSAKLEKTDAKKYKLFLDYTGTRAVGLSLQGKTYVYFNMPEEFTSLLANQNFKKSITATYNVPVVGLSGQGQYNSGSFSDSNITIDTATNSIVLEYNSSLSLALNDASKFSLAIDLDSLPASTDKVYTFYSMATDKNAISLSLLESKGAKAEIKLSDVPGGGGTNPGNGGGNNPGTGGGSNGGHSGDNGSGSGSGSGGGTAVNSGGQNSGSSSFTDWLGDRLPKTASNIWNIGLAGFILTLIGAAIKFIKFKKLT
jgi:hypothetical protein